MGYDGDELNYIYDKSDGYCHYCGKKLAWTNYGSPGEKGAWEVDHGIPLSRGGTDYPKNLWAICVECNREKGTMNPSEYKSYLRSVYGWDV